MEYASKGVAGAGLGTGINCIKKTQSCKCV